MKILLSLLKFSTPFCNVIEPEEYYLLGHEAVWSGVSTPMFRRHILHPHSGTNSKPNMGQAQFSTSCLLHVFLACSSSLKVEAVRLAETSVYFYQTTRHHIQEGLYIVIMSLDGIYIFGHFDCVDTANRGHLEGGGGMTGRLCPRQGHRAQ
jgi:hypothetical protein